MIADGTPYFVVSRSGAVTALDLASIFPMGVRNWDEAESLGLLLMQLLGFDDALKTPSGADGGIDVAAKRGGCQVKHWEKKVGRGDLQRLRGATLGKVAVFVAQTYSPQATRWADEGAIALFAYDPTALVRPLNAQAVALANDAPRHDPMGRNTHAASSLRVVRSQQWLSIIRRDIRVDSRRDERVFQSHLTNLSRAADRLALSSPTRRAYARRVSEFERAVTSLARSFNIELPD